MQMIKSCGEMVCRCQRYVRSNWRRIASGRGCAQTSRINVADAGLTLVELLVVLSILGLFAALAAPQVLKYLGGAKTGTSKTQLSNIQSAVELYYLDVGSYPPANVGLGALVKAPPLVAKWNGPYLKKQKAVIDPWGRPYQYRFPGKHGAFDLFTLGRDGQPGGTGEDQDINSW